MPASAQTPTPAEQPKKKICAEWRAGVPSLPDQTDAGERAALAGVMLSLAVGDDELTRGDLTRQAYKAIGSRTDKAEAVLANLEYCADNGIDYDPASRYGKKPGRPPIEQSSPDAPQRARTAMKTGGGGARAALAKYNELAEEENGTKLGEFNTRTLKRLAADGPDGIRAVRRPKIPMFTETNKEDRFSMAKVINKGTKRKRGREYWEFEKDTVHGDSFMVELGSGDMETKYEWLSDGEKPRPILVVKSPKKLMLHAWIGYDMKSKLVWCNKHGSMKGEASWLRGFFSALEEYEGECEEFGEGSGEACMNCATCKAAMSKAGHSFDECLEAAIPLMVAERGRPRSSAPGRAPVKLWQDAAGCQWTKEGMAFLAEKCKAPKATKEEMEKGDNIGRVLFSPTHRLGYSPGSAADGSMLDSGGIRHFKVKLRKRLAQEPGGRMVLDQERMWEICQEVWDDIDPKEFRPYFKRAAAMWKECERVKGAWVGWGKAGNAAHGVGL